MADDPTKAGPVTDEPEVDDVDELEGEQPEGGEGEEEEWTPPTREQWQAQQAAHKAALEAEKAKLARARKQAERLRKGGTAKPEGAAEGDGAQPATAGEADVWRRRAVRASAKAQLLDRGADSDTVNLMLGDLKPERIEFDDQDEPELDDWLDDMEERYPKMFVKAPAAPAAERPRTGRVEQGAPSGGRPVRPKLSLGEQIIAKSEAARLAGRRGIRG